MVFLCWRPSKVFIEPNGSMFEFLPMSYGFFTSRMGGYEMAYSGLNSCLLYTSDAADE